MTSKKSMIFLISLVLISITIMTTYIFDRNNPIHPNDRNEEGSNDLAIDEDDKGLIREQLKVAVSLDTDEYLKLVALSLEFEAYHRGLKIDVELIDEADVYAYYKKALQMGDAPDIMLLDNAWINEFAALSYLAQLDDTVANNMSELQIAPAVAQAKWNGLLWAVPKEVDPYVLVWNTDRLLEFGVTEMPESFDSLLAINYILSQDESESEEESEQIGFFLDLNDPYAFISAVWMLEGLLTDPVEQQVKIHNEETLHKLQALLYPSQYEAFIHSDNEEAEVHIQEANDTEGNGGQDKSQHVVYDSDGIWNDEDFDAWQSLNDGTIAMMLTTASAYQAYAEEHIRMTALPLHNKEESDAGVLSDGSWLAGKSFAVSSRSEHKKEAFEWIQSITTAEAQIELMNSGGGWPAMISAYGERMKSNLNYETIVKAIEHGQVFKAHPELPDKLKNLCEQLVQIRTNEMTLQDLLDELAAQEEVSSPPA